MGVGAGVIAVLLLLWWENFGLKLLELIFMADVGDKDRADTDEVKEAADDDLEVLISIWLFNDADELEWDGDADW